MSSICRNCGEELEHALRSDSEIWVCNKCGWEKIEQFVTKCCGVAWFVGGRGMTNYYVCSKCDQACDVQPVAKVTPGKKVTTHWVEEISDGSSTR